MSSLERTLLLIKPDALQRDLVGKVLTRVEEKGLQLIGVKMFIFDEKLLRSHYAHLVDLDFFPQLASYMTSGPSVAVCVQGVDAVSTLRSLTGKTKAREAEPGTIRGDLAMSVQKNLVHSSDSAAVAQTELSRFFGDDELFDFEDVLTSSIYSNDEIG